MVRSVGCGAKGRRPPGGRKAPWGGSRVEALSPLAREKRSAPPTVGGLPNVPPGEP